MVICFFSIFKSFKWGQVIFLKVLVVLKTWSQVNIPQTKLLNWGLVWKQYSKKLRMSYFRTSSILLCFKFLFINPKTSSTKLECSFCFGYFTIVSSLLLLLSFPTPDNQFVSSYFLPLSYSVKYKTLHSVFSSTAKVPKCSGSSYSLVTWWGPDDTSPVLSLVQK